jgi:hypothetical protein
MFIVKLQIFVKYKGLQLLTFWINCEIYENNMINKSINRYERKTSKPVKGFFILFL